MSNIKVGDKVRCLSGGVDIWVHSGKIYTVLDLKFESEISSGPCQCHYKCRQITRYIPAKIFYVVNGELGKSATILSSCFEKVD